MTATKKKLAIYFPDFQVESDNANTVSIFSEKSIRETENILSDAHTKMQGLLGLIVKKHKTKELKKQIACLKDGLDESIEQQKIQMAIRFEEETKRLQEKVVAEKEQLDIKMERLYYEAEAKMRQFSLVYEDVMKSESLLLELIQNEHDIIVQYQKYIELMPEDILHFREYIVYCDVQKKALDQINRYLAELI